MADAFLKARDALERWRAAYPADPYAADRHADALNERYLDPARLEAVRDRSRAFGALVAGRLADLVAGYQGHDPELEPYDGIGRRVERVRFDPAYHEAGRIIWESGLLRDTLAPGRSFEQANLFYLASLEGEMGHLCAATCTAGAIRVLRRAGNEALNEHVLATLGETDYDRAARAAQFLTEVQGGSDVGAIATRAEQDREGRWRISGEKWFCSVVDADLFLLLARPDGACAGTHGLACFLLPRLRDGRPNGFTIRRLKDKLGTRSMASGEIDFDRAVADMVGEPADGFRIMVTAMLNTSRWLNALGNAGILRRAWLEAMAYARSRQAFGQPIAGFPLLRRQLAGLKAEWLAALHSTWHLTALDEAVDEGRADAAARARHRFLVNANKLSCSLATTRAVRQAIEILGGNGAIESFSVLPRLLRDSVVYEQWEGTHNVLSAQVQRDFAERDLATPVLEDLTEGLTALRRGPLAHRARQTLEAVESLGDQLLRAREDPDWGAWHFRDLLERLLRAVQVRLLLEGANQGGSLAGELAACADWWMTSALEPGYAPHLDRRLPERVAALLGDDLG